MAPAVTAAVTLRTQTLAGFPAAVGTAQEATLSRARCHRVVCLDPSLRTHTNHILWVRTAQSAPADNNSTLVFNVTAKRLRFVYVRLKAQPAPLVV